MAYTVCRAGPAHEQPPSSAPEETHNSKPGLTATRCVFDLIENTTSALIVKHKPLVNGGVVRYREALRCGYYYTR